MKVSINLEICYNKPLYLILKIRAYLLSKIESTYSYIFKHIQKEIKKKKNIIRRINSSYHSQSKIIFNKIKFNINYFT